MNGNLANGAITSLIDEIGAAAIHQGGQPMAVSVDMSISFVSAAKMNVSFLMQYSTLQIMKCLKLLLVLNLPNI